MIAATQRSALRVLRNFTRLDRNMPMQDEKLTAYAVCDSDRESVARNAEALGIDVCFSEPDDIDTPVLRIGDEGLSLEGGGLCLRADLSHMLPRLVMNKLRGELLIRAAKPKAPSASAIDATAGFGEDSLLLAAVGYNVRLYEYNPVIAALLQDALMRASHDPRLSVIVARMELVKRDSISAMSELSASENPPELILLDPMFPARQKSGLVKKKFQLLQRIESPCSDEKELLDAAMSARPRKIVIKRPQKSPPLAGVSPSYRIEGNGIRYDCIVL